MIAQVAGLAPGDFVHTLGDAHLYLNHLEQAELQLSRTPTRAPRLELEPSVDNLFDFRFEHISIHDYEPHPHIKAEVAV